MKDAYYQIKVDWETIRYFVLTTHKGLFRYTRLSFRFDWARAIVEAAIGAVLDGLPEVMAYLEEIPVTFSDFKSTLFVFVLSSLVSFRRYPQDGKMLILPSECLLSQTCY